MNSPSQPTYKQGDTLLGKYRIEEFLGQGAFGEVYRVTHLQLNVQRAVKVLRRDAPGLGSSGFAEGLTRFHLEAQLGAELNTPAANPHLIQVHDFRQADDLLVLEMEYAPGGSLADRIARARESGQPIPVEEAVQVAQDVAAGLAALHQKEIVHRDLHPGNILFGQNGHAKIADMGSAQIRGGITNRTHLGSLAPEHPGHPDYRSPEHKIASQSLQPASDIYVLGMLLFEMLTGKIYHLQRPGTRAKDLSADVPAWLDELLAKMLSKDPEGRLWNGDEVVQALNKARNAFSQQPLRRKPKHQRWGIFIVFGLLISLLCISGAVLVWGGQSTHFIITFGGTPTLPATNGPNIVYPSVTSPAATDSAILSPVALHSTTIAPATTPSKTIAGSLTPEATPVPTLSAVPLKFCDNNDATLICVYALGTAGGTEQLVTLKFLSPENYSIYIAVDDDLFECNALTQYPDRQYCTGPMQPTNRHLDVQVFRSGTNQMIAKGQISFVATPVPAPTSTKKPKPTRAPTQTSPPQPTPTSSGGYP